MDQTVATSIDGTPEGVTRQLLEAERICFCSPSGLPWQSTLRVDDEKTTLVMNMQKDQSALFSGKMVSDISETLDTGSRCSIRWPWR